MPSVGSSNLPALMYGTCPALHQEDHIWRVAIHSCLAVAKAIGGACHGQRRVQQDQRRGAFFRTKAQRHLTLFWRSRTTSTTWRATASAEAGFWPVTRLPSRTAKPRHSPAWT